MKKQIIIGIFTILISLPTFAQYWERVGDYSDILSNDFNYCIEAITEYNGNLVVGGSFLLNNEAIFDQVALWNGTQWQALGNGIHASPSGGWGNVEDLMVYNNELYAAGGFWNLFLSYFLKWDGTDWVRPSFSGGSVGAAHALCIYKDKLYMGTSAQISLSDGNATDRIVSWNGTMYEAVGAGISGNGLQEPVVLAFAEYNNELYVAGLFDNAGGMALNNIARWDGTEWHKVNTGVNNIVYAMAVYNNELYVSGLFTQADGIVTRLAKWNGSQWLPVADVGGQIRAMAVYDNKLFIGGDYTTINELPIKYIATFDGTSWAEAVDSMGGEVRTLSVVNNRLYAGGCFAIYENEETIYHLARYSIVTNTENIKNNKITVYPNPVSDVIKITDTSEKPKQICIYDAIGHLVTKQASVLNVANIEVAMLPKGYYLLQITDVEGTKTFPFIKN